MYSLENTDQQKFLELDILESFLYGLDLSKQKSLDTFT